MIFSIGIIRSCFTMSQPMWSAAWLLGAASLAGCSFEPELQEPTDRNGDGGGGQENEDDKDDARYEQVSKVFDTLAKTVRAVRAFECECEVAGQTQTVEECVDATLTTTAPPIVACTKDILASDDRAVESLNCEAQAGVAYLECLRESTCSNFDHILDCQVEYDTNKLGNCSSLPWEIWAKVQTDCYGIMQPPPFTCDNGEIINSEWVCDLAEDCEDGSDESGCHP